MSTSFEICLIALQLMHLISKLAADSTESGACDISEFLIFKHTVATSDSKRECENAYNIFPNIHDEGADKFHDGECAYQCKLQLPYTCFNIHAPQTYQYDAGLLYIDTFEKIMSEKWKYALTDSHPLNYDAFFDFNMGFWVKSLDEYISHWKANTNLNLEYVGIEWYFYDINIDDHDFVDNKFYSILVHSPSSAINFEFISYTKPAIDFYNNIKWITDGIPRCSFAAMNNPYPWSRADGATIVPVRISHATTDINKLHDFYVNILDADVLYYAQSSDAPHSKTIFMHLLGTHIEIQFIERPLSQTFGGFKLDKYESLLMETHQSIMTSPYCGQDRWMDNHYAYSTWTIPGLMDKIYFNLNRYNQLYKVGKNVYKLSSVHTKYELDLVQYDGEYTFGLWVIEPGGQSIKIGGIISDPSVAYFASSPDPQWCPQQCNFGLVQGTVDPSHVYVDDLRFSQHEEIDDGMGISDVLTQEMQIQVNGKSYMINGIIIIFVVIIISVVFLCGMYRRKNECNYYNDYECI